MNRNTSTQALTIEKLRTRFEQWRQARQGKSKRRIPDELWSAAVDLARRDGVNPTAVALHLDAGKLKKLLIASSATAKTTAPPAFVELLAPDTSNRPEYTIELECRNGKLRIHCKGTTAADLAELSRALWNMAS
jgi:hypothetical protein